MSTFRSAYAFSSSVVENPKEDKLYIFIFLVVDLHYLTAHLRLRFRRDWGLVFGVRGYYVALYGALVRR